MAKLLNVWLLCRVRSISYNGPPFFEQESVLLKSILCLRQNLPAVEIRISDAHSASNPAAALSLYPLNGISGIVHFFKSAFYGIFHFSKSVFGRNSDVDGGKNRLNPEITFSLTH